jgi:hypothetical protein
MFRRRKDHDGPGSAGTSGYANPPGRDESMRVLAAFMAPPAPGSPSPGMAAPGMAAPGPSPGAAPGPGLSGAVPGPPPPLAATGWAGASPSPPPALNIRPLIGAEDSYANQPIRSGVSIPGAGGADADRLQQVFAQVNDLVTRLSGGADLSQRWTPEQVRAALTNLDAERSGSGLTDEQYQALKAALESMLTS